MSQHTIYDIARMAGVSGKTVSRVINNETGVSELTRARIAQIIDELGYQPHFGARSLRTQQRDCVGVIFPAPMHVVPTSQQQINWLFLELNRVFGMRGKFICFDLNPFESPDGVDYARALWQQRCNGCVIHGALPVDDQTIIRIHQSGYPYLTLNRLDHLPEISHASVDYEAAAYLSTRHLIERGHRRIGMLKAFHGFQAGLERSRGYLRAVLEAGLVPDESLLAPVTFAGKDVVQATQRLLDQHNVTALIDCSMLEDPTSLRVGAQQAGRTPGVDFEIVDWTYSARAAVLREACAHVWLPIREAASEGLELLALWFDRQRDEPVQVLLPPTLIPTTPDADFIPPTPIFDTLP